MLPVAVVGIGVDSAGSSLAMAFNMSSAEGELEVWLPEPVDAELEDVLVGCELVCVLEEPEGLTVMLVGEVLVVGDVELMVEETGVCVVPVVCVEPVVGVVVYAGV